MQNLFLPQHSLVNLRPDALPSESTDLRCYGDEPEILDRAGENAVTLAIWQRQLNPAVAPALDTWARSGIVPVQFLIDSRSFDLSTAFHGIPESVKDWLEQDVAYLIAQFCRIARVRFLDFAFGPRLGDECRKFHVDEIRMRLITTYVGPGTEWLPSESVRWENLLHPPECSCEANERIARSPTEIRQSNAGDVLLMKGAPDGAMGGLVHRSPPIEGTGQARVVLRLTTLDRP